MSSSDHTYGPTCHLAQSAPKPISKGDDDIPDLKAQFFYTSPLPIDDPLSAVPIPSGSESTKYPPRPFSAYDNNALEEAWLGLASERDRKYHFKGKPPQWLSKDDAERRASILKRIAAKDGKKPAEEEGTKTKSAESKLQFMSQSTKDGVFSSFPDVAKTLDNVSDISSNPKPFSQKQNEDETNEEDTQDTKGNSNKNMKDSTLCCSDADEKSPSNPCASYSDVANSNPGNTNCCPGENQPSDHGLKETEKDKSHESKEKPKRHGKGKQPELAPKASDSVGESQNDGAHDNRRTPLKDSAPDLNSKEHRKFERHERSKTHREHENHHGQGQALQSGPSRLSQSGPAGTTGLPFARVPSLKGSPLSQVPTIPNRDDEMQSTLAEAHSPEDSPSHTREPSEEVIHIPGCKAYRHSKGNDDVEVPVGISRLHLVKLPALQMKPIYWSPVHDRAAVTRGTWFYKDTMLPIESAVANQLEIGYRELRPWSQTWGDELNSAIEVGAAGEEKIARRLWPKEDDTHENSKKADRYGESKFSSEPLLSTDPYCAAKCFNGEAAAIGTLDDEKPADTATIIKRYPLSYVIYKDPKNAFILKQSLVPSAYYGRKPLTKIMRGHTVGVHVVRGFDWKAWEKLHPSKKTTTATKAEENAPTTGDTNTAKSTTCPACLPHEERPEVTDLVLVIHGIGQKLSERVESFHFTHAINAFRRSVNIELVNEAVQPVLRKGLGGVMVLPVNWRSNLSFEEGGPKKGTNQDKDFKPPDDFTLQDITPETIPAVRSLISDVMLDIPFYMSHHKPKMIEALVTEANRVFALWNKNNPGFQKDGRVHLIAHSLGSVMALDVLSHQPSFVPKSNPGKKINIKHFDFDTTNLFLVGSPAGFFLLLEKGNLAPRKGRSKPDADLEDVNSRKGITGEIGTFGSLAVDNVYNVMHYNDPIAYRVNATVDPLYASSLKSAQVPSATTGWFEAMGKAIKSITPGVTASADLAVGQVAKPATMQRLPSTLEMEVHDFTREEIAEKKFYLLNDNGQVDWFLSSGGGPLEIQYLNMLGAHSSYWVSPDFVRMIVTEVGRAPGKNNTLPNLRAAKLRQHKRK